jgi:hypothetical protein
MLRNRCRLSRIQSASTTFGTFCIVFAVASHGLAASRVELEYTAPAGCPSRDQFLTAVAERGGSLEHSDSVSPLALRVSIQKGQNDFTGTLEVQNAQNQSGKREIHAHNCQEVVDGLAVVTSIALREDTSQHASNAASEESSTQNVSDASVEQPEAPAQNAQPEATRVRENHRQDSRLRSVGVWDNAASVAVTAGKLGVNRSQSVTLTAGAIIGAIPTLVIPRYDLTYSLANFITTPESQKYLIGSIPRVRITLLGNSTYDAGAFETSVRGFKTGVGTCASFWFDLKGFVVLGCADFAIGMMQLETKDSTGTVTQSKSVGQGTAGIEFMARYNLSSFFHVGLNVGGEVWMSKLTAERPDGSRIFSSKLLNAHAELGVGFNF